MKLAIDVKFVRDGKPGTAHAEVPFETGRHDLPKEYPFTEEVNYVGPDAGYSLSWLDIDAKGRKITFGYVWTVVLDEEGKGRYVVEKRTGDMTFEFSLI